LGNRSLSICVVLHNFVLYDTKFVFCVYANFNANNWRNLKKRFPGVSKLRIRLLTHFSAALTWAARATMMADHTKFMLTKGCNKRNKGLEWFRGQRIHSVASQRFSISLFVRLILILYIFYMMHQKKGKTTKSSFIQSPCIRQVPIYVVGSSRQCHCIPILNLPHFNPLHMYRHSKARQVHNGVTISCQTRSFATKNIFFIV
jgi:hypothetical protein